MKKSILETTLAVGLLFCSLQAIAQTTPVENEGDNVSYAYQCGADEDKTLTVTTAKEIDGVLKAQVQVNKSRNGKYYSAILQKLESPLFGSEIYELFQSDVKVGELKIVTHQTLTRAPCGRAGCPVTTHAHLKIGEDESSYLCL